MCAGGNAEIKGRKVSLYMGYYGGSLTVGKRCYKQGKTAAVEGEKEKFIKYLKRFTKEELINMMIDLVENSDE